MRNFDGDARKRGRVCLDFALLFSSFPPGHARRDGSRVMVPDELLGSLAPGSRHFKIPRVHFLRAL